MHVLFALFLFISTSNGAKILAFFGTPSISHQITYQPVWRELALRGHDVTVITTDPIGDKSIKNLREIDLHDISYAVWNKHNISSLGADEELGPTDIGVFMNCLREIINTQLSQSKVKDIIQNVNNEKYDLVFVEYMALYTYPFKEIYNCPIVAIYSMPLLSMGHEYLGNPVHPILQPDIHLPYGKTLNSFQQRIGSVANHLIFKLLMKSFGSMFEELIKKHYPNIDVSIFELATDVSMVFTNVNPILQPIRANVPAIKEFNGMHIKKPKALPNDLKLLMDDAKEGIIYVSFGSNIKSSRLPKSKLKILLETFSELPYKVLWKFETDELQDLPSNVVIRKWFPQQDLLRHKNLKLFITQGGLQSLDEAMYTKIPVIVVPFFGDQQGNARKAEEIGIGKFLRFATLSKEDIKSTIFEILNDEKYKNRCDEIYNILTDVPTPALDKVVWWIEYVLRHKGANHLRSPAIDLPWYQYFMLDIIALFTTVVFVAIYIVYKISKLILRQFNRLKVKTQ